MYVTVYNINFSIKYWKQTFYCQIGRFCNKKKNGGGNLLLLTVKYRWRQEQIFYSWTVKAERNRTEVKSLFLFGCDLNPKYSKCIGKMLTVFILQ